MDVCQYVLFRLESKKLQKCEDFWVDWKVPSKVSNGCVMETAGENMVNSQQKTILIVDAEPATGLADADLLREFGYAVVVASSGEIAVELTLASDNIDLVLTEIDLGGGIDGADAARRILAKRMVPIVFHTAHVGEEYVDRVRGITRYGYVARRSGPHVLRSTIEAAFELFAATRTAQKLLESEERYRSILNASPDDITVTDLEGRILMTSPAAMKMFRGEKEEQWLGRMVTDFLVPEDRERALSKVAGLFQGVKPVPSEYRGLRLDGSILDIEVHSQLIRGADGRPNSIMIIVRDISKRKQAEEKVKSLLAEKELLLKEVHHRIKNNMNTVKALLSLQEAAVDDPVAVAALKDAGSRVQSMMRLYDKLYRSEGFTSLLMDDYLATLVDEIVANFPNRESVEIEKNLEPIKLDARRMSSLGMIINELITNIMKYAFVGMGRGHISISASMKDHCATVVVKDNGVGMSGALDIASASGFGLWLVHMLTQQLEGTIRVEQNGGTAWVLEFTVP